MAFIMTSCSKPELAGNIKDDKNMLIKANKSAAGDNIMSGAIEIAEGESIKIVPDLKEGSIKLEFIKTEGEDNIEEVPDNDGEATLTANLTGTEVQEYGNMPGAYMVKATVLEKATGTIEVTAG